MSWQGNSVTRAAVNSDAFGEQIVIPTLMRMELAFGLIGEKTAPSLAQAPHRGDCGSEVSTEKVFRAPLILEYCAGSHSS